MAEAKEPEDASRLIRDEASLERLREAAAECTGCDLYKNATQTVFGDGPEGARIMFVGEQPGDSEDHAGHPFVGGAGRLLDRCLEAAGIDREAAYVTNAVKHFRRHAPACPLPLAEPAESPHIPPRRTRTPLLRLIWPEQP